MKAEVVEQTTSLGVDIYVFMIFPNIILVDIHKPWRQLPVDRE